VNSHLGTNREVRLKACCHIGRIRRRKVGRKEGGREKRGREEGKE
jgi:hypothetical protein